MVIVGTGYGGSVAAAELARTRGTKRICILERGGEHLPGSFPSRMSQLAGHVRFSTKESCHPRGRREGLFDVRVGDDLCALVANGVGGGSLINAGVMELPDAEVFAAPPWPQTFHQSATIVDLFQLGAVLRQRLGATQTMKSVSGPEPRKYTALGKLAATGTATPLPVTVALTDAPDKTFRTAAGINVDACIRCGNCATGCNYNAKLSLDVTLLAEARQHGAEVFSGATVLKVEKLASVDGAPAWQLHVVHTDEALRRRHGEPTLVRARRVILAAGTFGSTEILMRSQRKGFGLSPKLGHQVSSNGDLIVAAYGGKAPVNCVADEDIDPRSVPAADQIGPTITGMVDLRKSDEMLIQDLAVPGPLRSMLEQTVTTTAAIHMLAESDMQPHDWATRDACAVDPQAIRNTQVFAIIGHDSADGVMKLNSSDEWDNGDGAATIRWPELRSYPPLLERHRKFEALLQDSGVGARALPSPMWRLLPEKLDYLFDGKTGPLLTVHPLGGCPMGDDSTCGVVDDCGRVFDDSRSGGRLHHEGLVVLDGSIVPASLGMNPALTIASLALRAIGALRADWGYTEVGAGEPLRDRPYFKRPQPVEPAQDTLIEVTERLSGPVAIEGMPHDSHVELTLRFDPASIKDLTCGTDAATLKLQPANGRLRIFSPRPPDDTEAADEKALLVASVTGTLRVFSHEKSSPIGRQLRAWWAWLCNRGLRDSVLWTIDKLTGKGPAQTRDLGIFQDAKARLKNSWELSSRAGAVRLFKYELKTDAVLRSSVPEDVADSFRTAAIRGEKRLTYSRRANPWRQLMEVTLKTFPRARTAGAVLALDTGYLARQGVPLLRVVQQQDKPKALVDIASLGLYLARVLVHTHAWSFRQPDIPEPRNIQRLPGRVPGLPKPVVHEFKVDKPRNNLPVKVRLTHYPRGTTKPSEAAPILLIHGYSASGTTFAHHAVRPNLATALWDHGRDVWIADMRTSAGMPHAKEPWAFEEAGMADIPVAVHQVCTLTGAEKVDVFAHCMGSAMLGMALLGSESQQEELLQLRRDLPNRIRRLVMSQVAPAVIFTPENVFRAYAMRYLKHYLPLHDYEFRPSRKPGTVDRLIDLVLASLPYPEKEFDRENPLWPPWRRTPWVGTRHRMDALYGRDFNVNNLPPKVLDYIDDHFGPMNVDTVSQAIHFARYRTITNCRGFNDYVTPESLREKFRFPILHVHGQQNGLVSDETPTHFGKVLKDSDPRFGDLDAFEPKLYRDAGHQDLLIGSPAAAMFNKVNAFLDQGSERSTPKSSDIRITFESHMPAYGVRLDPFAPGKERHSLGDYGRRDDPIAVLLIPVAEHDGRYVPVDEKGPAVPTPDYLRENVAWRAVQPVSPGRERTRYTFDLAGYAPPAPAKGILVLLTYNQSHDIAPAPPSSGGRSLDELAVNFASGDSIPTSALVDGMVRSVEHTLRKADSTDLALGVVRPPPRPSVSKPPPTTRRFALASCHYPGGLFDRTPPGAARDAPPGPSDASYMRLLEVLEGERGDQVPEFLVLAGDQIYADATAGLFDPRVLDDRHRLSYEAFFGARGPRSVFSRLPAVMRLDDHELDDNWEPDPPGANQRKGQDNECLKKSGIQEFLRNQCNREPDPSVPAKLWHQTPMAGFEFFWADARTERTPRTATTVESASLLGEPQSTDLDNWLADRKVKGPRFLVSASPVLPRRLEARGNSIASCIRSDAWEGYPASLHRLLAGVYKRGSDDVVFLSGNEHVSSVSRIEISKLDGSRKVAVAHSVHSSALYAPYPFANATAEDFAGNDEFTFSHGGARYRCSVTTWFPSPGDGFAVLSVSPAKPGWLVSVRFDRENKATTDPGNTKDFCIKGGRRHHLSGFGAAVLRPLPALASFFASRCASSS
ncbi:alpha/beta fold hydrolase [Caenimonas soli]|uniref:alpha/beta fold hydrolase n=1 Tax=Caenimonas soli TaxID=2735555 RepID=UPI001555F790|nr:alpha/beta fold hydrolase [Caenimonas soli]NPC56320.1 alpha/beta fold hydrolase [Caenimonas soli]